DLAPLRYYSIASAEVAGLTALLARTGYTGEDGFEILVQNRDAVTLWRALLATGEVRPCGLASRDTLRLEAGMPLYGHELNLETTPYPIQRNLEESSISTGMTLLEGLLFQTQPQDRGSMP
ncbi:MAG: hypothetical protein RL044_525, partial [Actinomycetota bacterium]